MLFISGTKRSGTSMWMQVLQAAGVPILGKAFPRNWANVPLRQANPDGFYESILRQGIYFATNPHPRTGKYFLPEHVEGYAVKVFIPGVIRSERAYISQVVANIRAWREYERSILRLYAMEDEARAPDIEAPFRFPPALEWWMENFALIRDISLRRYPSRLQAYDQIVERPAEVLPEIFAWIGREGTDVDAAIAAVKPENRTQIDTRSESSSSESASCESEGVSPKLAQVFDDLYAAVRERNAITGPLLATLNKTNQELLPELGRLQHEVIRSQQRTQAQVRAKVAAAGKTPGQVALMGEAEGLPKIEW